MNNSPLMQVALDSIIFFGMSTDDVVQPDAAVSQLEAIGSTLQELSESERQEFLNYVREIAEREELAEGRTTRVEFLTSIGENLGLI
jgi:hypothetical protein